MAQAFMPNFLKQFADNLSVRNKGILLVCIPLTFQILLSVLLGFLYAQAEQQAYKESRARLFVVRANSVISSMYDAGQMLVVYTALPDKAMYDRWLARKAVLLKELDSIKKLSIDGSSESYERLLAIGNKGIKLMDDCFRRTEQGVKYSIYEAFPEVKLFTDSVMSDMEYVLTKDLKSQVASTMFEERSRKLIASSLFAGLMIDVLIAIGLSLFFGVSIENRLKVISDNTKKIRERKELNARVDGSDEIAALDREFHDLTKELRESERLRSEFISMVSHDMKSPLMSVELSLEGVERKLKATGDDKFNDDLKAINANMRRVMGLIRDILELERGASGKLTLELEELNVDDLFARVTMGLRALATQKNVELSRSSDGDSLFADKRRLEQVLINLLTNALKFAPAGSVVRLTAKRIQDEVEIRVTDSGAGVPEADRARIFDKFEQSTKGDTIGGDTGSGLGLAICKTIIESHGGQIGFEPNEGGGSQFWIRLKAAD